MIEIRLLFFLALYATFATSHPYYNGFSRNPYNQGYGIFNYANQIPYNTYIPSFPEPDLAFYLSQNQPFNLLAEAPQVIGTTFSILPMFAVPKENVNMVSSANILGVSQKKPMLTIRTETNSLLQCVPGVRIELEQPMWIYSLKKTSIVFPSEVLIYHGGYRIPLKVGAVLAPVTQDSFFFNQVPVEVRVVYAVPLPSKPINVETVTTTQQVQNTIVETIDNQAVVVESNESEEQGGTSGFFENPKNVTIVEFPNKVASPTASVSEEDEELVNRNPPQILVPAGIVQSTQPEILIEPFHNSKESPVLTQLKQEKLKQKLKIREAEEFQVHNTTSSESGSV